MATDNKSLARFILDGVLPAPRGVPQVDVEFSIDANGIVTVAASDKATSKEQHVTIQSASGLTEEEVERLRQEADLHAAEDQEKKAAVEARNAADTLAYTAEKTLRENEDKVDDDLKQRVEGAVKEVRDALEGEDTAAVTAASATLSEAMQEIGQAVYGAVAEDDGGQGEDAPEADAEAEGEAAGTVEGEFREV